MTFNDPAGAPANSAEFARIALRLVANVGGWSKAKAILTRRVALNQIGDLNKHDSAARMKRNDIQDRLAAR
jgi:hypothetical protein